MVLQLCIGDKFEFQRGEYRVTSSFQETSLPSQYMLSQLLGKREEFFGPH